MHVREISYSGAPARYSERPVTWLLTFTIAAVYRFFEVVVKNVTRFVPRYFPIEA
jgi:hypothetical protein